MVRCFIRQFSLQNSTNNNGHYLPMHAHFQDMQALAFYLVRMLLLCTSMTVPAEQSWLTLKEFVHNPCTHTQDRLKICICIQTCTHTRATMIIEGKCKFISCSQGNLSTAETPSLQQVSYYLCQAYAPYSK